MALHTFTYFAALPVALLSGVILSSSVEASINFQERSPNLPAASQVSVTRGTLIAGQLGFSVGGVRPSRSRVGGISRGAACTADGSPIQIIPLLPKSNPQVAASGEIEIESTISGHPTFFVYIPQTIARSAEFILTTDAQDDQSVVYETTVPLPPESGVVGVTLPTSIAPLEVGGIYHWSMSLLCDEVDRSGNPLVDGWVQRVEASPILQSSLGRSQPRNQPAVYAREGIWQDTLSTLATLRLANPEDAELNRDWVSLLSSVDLQSIAQAPLLKIDSGSQATDGTVAPESTNSSQPTSVPVPATSSQPSSLPAQTTSPSSQPSASPTRTPTASPRPNRLPVRPSVANP